MSTITKAKKSENFTEEFQFDAKVRVDREKGIIHDVKVLGRQSLNKREYTAKAMEQAMSLYDEVNANHPDDQNPYANRSIQEAIGWLENKRIQGDGIYADLHLLTNHPYTPLLLEAAEKRPTRFGLSHNADGMTTIQGDGTKLIESIDRVISVDIVQRPATTRGFFESEERKPMATQKNLKEFVAAIAVTVAGQPGLAKLLEEDATMAAMPAPADVPEDASPDDQIWAAFEQACVSALQEGKTDHKAAVKKISDILKAYQKVAGTGDSAKADDPPPADSDTGTMESLRLRVRQLESENQCRNLLESKNINPTAARVAALAGTSNEQHRASLMEDWRQIDQGQQSSRGASKPVVRPAREASTGGSYEQLTKEGMAKALR